MQFFCKCKFLTVLKINNYSFIYWWSLSHGENALSMKKLYGYILHWKKFERWKIFDISRLGEVLVSVPTCFDCWESFIPIIKSDLSTGLFVLNWQFQVYQIKKKKTFYTVEVLNVIREKLITLNENNLLVVVWNVARLGH
jgi:hypothetical protein